MFIIFSGGNSFAQPVALMVDSSFTPETRATFNRFYASYRLALMFGNGYHTPDGTGVRDYIHAVNLAEGHLCTALEALQTLTGAHMWNLGTARLQRARDGRCV